MGCINKNQIIKSDISQQFSKEDLFKIKEENNVNNNSLKNSNNNNYKSNNIFYANNSNNSGSNVTSNNKLNNQNKNNSISSLISNDYFNNKYTIIGEISNQQSTEEFKIQLKSNLNVFRSMRIIRKNSKKHNNEEEDNTVFEEVKILKGINHKHICQLYECVTTPHNYFLIMDYCKEGNLESKLKWSIKYSESQIKYLAFQLFGAVQYLNKNNYMHTDIKPINILIDEIIKNDSDEDLFNIKLLNFGSYGESIESNSNINRLPYYVAPEVINNKFDVTSDVWSIGVIIYQMFYGEVPFGGDNVNEVYANINKGKITQSLSASSNLKDLLNLIFVKDCKKRINVNKCLEHKWFYVGSQTEKNTDIFKKCIIEEINTDINVNKIDEKNSQNTYTSKNNEESLKSNNNDEDKKSNKIIINKNNKQYIKFIAVGSRNGKKSRKTWAIEEGKNRKISPFIKYCILFIKYHIRINFHKDKEINKLNNIYLKYKIENNINLFTNYINNIKKLSFDSFYYNKSNRKLLNNLKEQINHKEELFKILIENKKKFIEINLKKSFDKLKKSSVEEIKNKFKEINNINLCEIQKYKIYFNELEFEMEKNKYKQIYLFIDFYKLLINSINKLYTQFISNNISSTNVDSNYTTNTYTQHGINNKSKESIKNDNSKDNIDKIIFDQNNKNQEDKEKIIPMEKLKKDEKNNNNKKNKIGNNININVNTNNIIISKNNNENIDDNNLNNQNIINDVNIENGNININIDNKSVKNNKKMKLNQTNIIHKGNQFADIIMNKNKRSSFNKIINNFDNFNKNKKKLNDIINNNIDKHDDKDEDEDYYETEKKKNDKNRFDPEKFLAIIGFS